MVEINNVTDNKIDDTLVEKVVHDFLKAHDMISREVSIGIINDEKMREINNQYRGKDKTTDVLSFEGEDDFLGEILISLAQIDKQAKELDKTPKEELIFILVHGLYHLLGYTDETEEGRLNMIDLANKFIKKRKYNYD